MSKSRKSGFIRIKIDQIWSSTKADFDAEWKVPTCPKKGQVLAWLDTFTYAN